MAAFLDRLHQSISSARESPSAAVVLGASTTSALVGVVWYWRRRQQHKQRFQGRVECVCGKVCLQVDEQTNKVVHMVCYCDHCQHYAQCLRARQRSVVDVQGGTRTCQVYRRSVRLVKGAEYLQFSYFNPNQVPLRPQQMFRGHTTCCNSPLISAFWRELPVMGLYAANIQLQQDDSDNGKNCEYNMQINPTTQLWENDAKNHLYRINCECALLPSTEDDDDDNNNDHHGEGTAQSASSPGEQTWQEPKPTPPTPPIQPPKGSPTFPVTLLVRFLWRNYVVGHAIDAKNDFGMPPDQTPVLIPSQMKNVPVAFFRNFLDLVFG